MIACISMVGCANIDYRRIYTKSGSIIDEVNITLSKDMFNNSNSEALYGTIKSDVDNYYRAVTQWIDDNMGDKYVSDINLGQEFKENISVRTTERRASADGYTFSIIIEFTSIEYYIYFYGLNTPEILAKYGVIDIEGVKGFDIKDYGQFMTDIVTSDYDIREDAWCTKKLVFGSDSIVDKFGNIYRGMDQKYLDYYVTRVNSLLSTSYTSDEVLDNIDIIQSFETNDKRFKSNADKVYNDPELNGYIVHEWNLNDLNGKEMELYRLSPVRVWWYVIGLAVAGISILYMFIRNANLKTKKEKNNNG